MGITIFLFILGFLMFVEGIILFLFSSKVNTILGSFFKNDKALQVVGLFEFIMGGFIMLVMIL